MQTTTTAADAYVQKHAVVMSLLTEIEEAIQDLPAPDFQGFTPHWGHVGDLELVIKCLGDARDQLRPS